MNLVPRDRDHAAFAHLFHDHLALMDAKQPAGRDPSLMGISECIVYIDHAIELQPTLKMAVAVDMKLSAECPQLHVEPCAAKHRKQPAPFRRDSIRHDIDAREEMREGYYHSFGRRRR